MPNPDHAQLEPEMNPDHEQSAKFLVAILVVDDDAINLMVIEQMLDTSGYPVVSAVDGVDAVEKAALVRPALILMDISMPRMNGIEAAIAIREQSAARCPKIIAVTANVIPACTDQNPCAHSRMPIEMIFHGRSISLFQASQQSATMSS